MLVEEEMPMLCQTHSLADHRSCGRNPHSCMATDCSYAATAYVVRVQKEEETADGLTKKLICLLKGEESSND